MILKDIYIKYWAQYIEQIRNNPNIEPAYPYLMVEPKGYRDKSVKVMFCGQETQGWGNEFDNEPEKATLEAISGIYAGFVNSGGYNSPYWQFINRVKKECQNASFICNNIVKIGKKRGAGCDDKINNLTLKYFPVIKEEIQILEPQMIIFLTGNRYYERIEKALGKFSSKNVGKGLDKLTFEDETIPISYCCYHPKYLRMKHLENDVRSSLIEIIKSLTE